MESNAPDENVSSHPLQHLLSLEWDDSNDMSQTTKSAEEEDKPLKQKKKVRFSDTVEQNYLDSNDLESNLTESEGENDSLSQDEEFSVYEDHIDYEENIDNEENIEKDNIDDEDSKKDSIDDDKDSKKDNIDDEENSESNEPSELEIELNKNLSQSEVVPYSGQNDLMESTCLSVNSQTKNLKELNTEVEKQILQFSCQIQNEKSDIELGGTGNKFDDISSDISVLHASKNDDDSLGTVSSEKKNYKCDERILQKQSEKINELLKHTDLTFSNALQIRQAVWEAWSTVKKWEYITMKRDRKNANEKSDHITESLSKKAKAIPKPQTSQKQMMQKKKKGNLCYIDKPIQLLNKPKEKSKADKEAFKSWKKQKEESLKQNAIKRHNEKLQKRMSSLMNEEIKKERAESAYIEWKMKKVHITKKENEKKAWLMLKEKEVNEQKLQRDKEAQEIFHEWLERKYFTTENCSMISNGRPPWLPPGNS